MVGKRRVLRTRAMHLCEVDASPVTPFSVGVNKRRGDFRKDKGSLISECGGYVLGCSERRITRSYSRLLGGFGCEKTWENSNQVGSGLFEDSDCQLRKIRAFRFGGGTKGTNRLKGKERRSDYSEVIVCGLPSELCDSSSGCTSTPRVRQGRQCRFVGCLGKDGKASECGVIVGNSKRMVTRSASKAMQGKSDFCGQTVEKQGTRSSSRLVVRKAESTEKKKAKPETDGLSNCLMHQPEAQKRMTRSSSRINNDIKMTECHGYCRVDSELDIVSCDPLPLYNSPGGAEGKTLDIKEDPELVGIERGRRETKLQRTDHGWTKEQEVALQNAYFTAKPSPHFWKQVAKLVPGKSAQECFDKVNSNNLTPLSTRASAKTKKCDSPAALSFSSGELLKSAEKKIKRTGKTKRKRDIARKTVRHLLQKYSHLNQDSEADLFSVLEPTVNPQLNTEQLTPKHKMVSPGSSSSSRYRKKPLSRFSGFGGSPLTSPPVLKKVKNMALHEKYIDQLHTREAKRKVATARRLKAIRDQKNGEENQTAAMKDVIRAAKSALIFEARDAIHNFQHSQTNIRENLSDSEEVLSSDDEEEDTTL